MNARSAFPPTPDEPPSEAAEADPRGRDGVAVRDARRQRWLEDLAELGMGVVRTVARAAEAVAEAAPGEIGAIAMAFTRVSRAVRLTEALADRLDHPPAAAAAALKVGQRLPEGAVVVDAVYMQQARIGVRGKINKLLVRDKVGEAIEAEAGERGDGFDAEALMDAADRLIDDWRARCRDIASNIDLEKGFYAGDERLFCEAVYGLLPVTVPA